MTRAVTEMQCLHPVVCKGYCMAYAGPAPREAIAQQIASAIGPSGPNDEYLYGLVRALQEVCVGTPPPYEMYKEARLLSSAPWTMVVLLSTVPKGLQHRAALQLLQGHSQMG